VHFIEFNIVNTIILDMLIAVGKRFMIL